MTSSLRIVRQHGVTVIFGPERIVAGATEELRAAAMTAIEQTGRVVLHLGFVAHIDSTGLGLLTHLCASARKRSGDVKLAAPSAITKKVLEITLLGRMFRVYDDIDSAVGAFSSVDPTNRNA